MEIYKRYTLFENPLVCKIPYRITRFCIALFLLLIFLTLPFVYKNTKKSRIIIMEKEKEQVLDECLKFINVEVTKCLTMKERKHQNRLFSNIKTSLPIRPVKMTLTTAVFLFKTSAETYIIKRIILKPESDSQEEVISLNLQHKNILSTFASKKEYFTTDKGVKHQILWLFSEYLQERIVQAKVGRDEEIIRKILTDSLEALSFMHSKEMIHLDLKMANIMGEHTEEGIVYKFIDFGYSRDLSKEIDGTTEEVYIHRKAYGTFPYKSPEVVINNIHGKASDVWCIGAIAWFLSLGKTPFYTASGEKNTESHKKFLTSTKKLTFYRETSKELKHFIELAMQKNRKKRPTAYNLLKHPFILGCKLGSPESSDFEDEGYYSHTSSEEDDL